MIVIDASAVIEWVLQTPKGAEVEARIFRKRRESPRLHALICSMWRLLRSCESTSQKSSCQRA